MTEVRFPGLSTDRPDADGVVATWFVLDGESVTEGQLLAEVQVDKVAAEVPAPVGGIVHVLVAEDTAVSQGSTIARID
jgi:pyruvate/2-oxoglutarate dehydrogenase complex dihydrolipoamide acyltransferase (E2) component